MKKRLCYLAFGLIFMLITSCSNNNINYIDKEKALNENFIVIDGAQSENQTVFYDFLDDVNNGDSNEVSVIIYDLIDNSYVIDINFDGREYLVSGYFIDTKSKVSDKFSNLVYTDLIQTSSKNYFLRDSNNLNDDIWVFQED